MYIVKKYGWLTFLILVAILNIVCWTPINGFMAGLLIYPIIDELNNVFEY